MVYNINYAVKYSFYTWLQGKNVVKFQKEAFYSTFLSTIALKGYAIIPARKILTHSPVRKGTKPVLRAVTKDTLLKISIHREPIKRHEATPATMPTK